MNPKGNPQNLKPFPPGVSGNPGGKPKKAKDRLQAAFLNALADDFEAHGIDAIRKCREKDPSAYLRIFASLMPRELDVSRPPEGLTDDELDAAIDFCRRASRDEPGDRMTQ